MNEREIDVPGPLAGLGLAILVFVVVAPALLGCGSLPKPALREEVLALDKNAPIRELGLLKGELTIEVEGQERSLPFTYLHAPHTAGSRGDDPTPVVFVHGTPSTLCTWVEPIFGGQGFAGLRESRDCYAIEVAGHGMAEASLAPYDFERCADFLGAAIEALGLDRVHLVGSSYGGEFAWRTALDQPELVRSLVLLDSSGYPRRDEDWLPEEVKLREYSIADWGWLLNSRDRIAFALEPHFDVTPPDRVDEFFLVCDNKENWRAMVDLARDENGTRAAEIPGIEAPTLVLWGERDLAYDSDYYAARFARDIPRAELLVLPATGHYPHEERPGEVVRALEDFFARNER